MSMISYIKKSQAPIILSIVKVRLRTTQKMKKEYMERLTVSLNKTVRKKVSCLDLLDISLGFSLEYSYIFI